MAHSSNTTFSPIWQHIVDHRLLFCISLPVCFATLVVLVSFMPKMYKSTFVIAPETEQAVEVNRAITLNQPANYDLGIARTDNAIKPYGYSDVLKSDAFLYELLACEVSTLDGSFSGKVGDYLTFHQKQAFWWAWINNIFGSEPQPIDYATPHEWYTRQEVDLINGLRKSITVKMDYESKFVTISCMAQDPAVATQLARHINEHLLRSIDDYETQKMLGMLEQLQIRSDEAEKAYQDALAVGASNAATLKEIVESFKRQQVVLQGQIVHHPAFTTLTEPSFQYRKAAPSRWKMPLVLTLILGICLLAWVNRKEIIRFL